MAHCCGGPIRGMMAPLRGAVMPWLQQQSQQHLLSRPAVSAGMHTLHRPAAALRQQQQQQQLFRIGQRRELSIMEKFQDSMSARADKQQLQQFKDQVKKMVEGPKYTLASWDAEMTDAMSSWRMMVPGTKSQPEVQKMEAFKEIIAKMTAEEKENPGPLANDTAALERIAAAADRPAEDVKLLLQRFQTLVVYQDWLLQRKASGKRMPRNMDDMQTLARGDMEKKQKKQMRGRFRRF